MSGTIAERMGEGGKIDRVSDCPTVSQGMHAYIENEAHGTSLGARTNE